VKKIYRVTTVLIELWEEYCKLHRGRNRKSR